MQVRIRTAAVPSGSAISPALMCRKAAVDAVAVAVVDAAVAVVLVAVTVTAGLVLRMSDHTRLVYHD